VKVEPRSCPFCLAETVRVFANFDDCLIAYRCPRCRGVFYTIVPQFDEAMEPEPAKPARRTTRLRDLR
jgi:Zn-finger nucleic acid-binding protein